MSGMEGVAAAAHALREQIKREKWPKETRTVLRTTTGWIRPFDGKPYIDTPCQILEKEGDQYLIRVFEPVTIPGGINLWYGEKVKVPKHAIVTLEKPIPVDNEVED